jgi:hypothetical protein
MENRTEILNELQSLSPTLTGLHGVNVYTVPNGYFDVLSEDILLTIQLAQYGIINSAQKQDTTDVPQGYFENLADTILAKIKQEDNVSEELRHLSPMLYSVQNENVYTVPKNYFEQLHTGLVEKVQPQQAIVTTMRKRNFTFIKYAVAALFTGIITFGAFKFTTTNKLDDTTKQGLAIAKNNSFDTELDKLTDEDIEKYLSNSSTDADVALIVNVVDENELPTQEDYLTDEKALDNFLDNVNLEDLKN